MGFKSKGELEMVLAQVGDFENADVRLEQYSTPSSIAAGMLWKMAMRGEIDGRVVLDAGCGSGILGIGCLLLGARKVYFVDSDQKCIDSVRKFLGRLKKEYELGETVLMRRRIEEFRGVDNGGEIEVVVQNPPFGTKREHADREFLVNAFSLSPLVYSFHKSSTKGFVKAIAKDFGYRAQEAEKIFFPLRAQFAFHKKRIERIEVSLWRFERA